MVHKTKSSGTISSFASRLLLIVAAVYIAGIAACSVEEPREDDNSVLIDRSVQDMDQNQRAEESWIYISPQDSVDWTGLYIDQSSSLWTTEDNFILFHEPLVFESIDKVVVCVQTIDGISGINGVTGEVLWEKEVDVAAYYADGTVPELHIVDISGFTVSLDPFNGEVSSYYFSSWETVSVSDDWPPVQFTAMYHEMAFRLNRDSLARLAVEEHIDTDTLDSSIDSSDLLVDESDVLISELPFRAAVLPSSYLGSEESVSFRFSIPVSGRYEFFVSNFESQPVLFGISSEEGMVLQSNEDYGAITDGFVIDLNQSSMYELWFRSPRDFPEDALIIVNAALLLED